MAETIKILSENDKFQHIEVLRRNRQKRQRSKEFFVEGVKAINNAIAHNWEISAFVYRKEHQISKWAENILMTSRADIHYELNTELMNKLSAKEEASELIALVKIPPDDPARIKFRSTPLVILLDRPTNPGNIGTIIRSCESFRADGMIISGHSADLYDPQTIRASVGTIFTLPVIRMGSHKDVLNWVSEIKHDWKNIRIVGSSAKADNLHTETDFREPTIFLLGNETKGLSENYRLICDQMVSIPIHGSASSLNVACAASIFLHEIDRQRSIKRSPA
jgi:23S rRNA (uridine2479-2'-O)-methyltransferase